MLGLIWAFWTAIIAEKFHRCDFLSDFYLYLVDLCTSWIFILSERVFKSPQKRLTFVRMRNLFIQKHIIQSLAMSVMMYMYIANLYFSICRVKRYNLLSTTVLRTLSVRVVGCRKDSPKVHEAELLLWHGITYVWNRKFMAAQAEVAVDGKKYQKSHIMADLLHKSFNAIFCIFRCDFYRSDVTAPVECSMFQL